MTEIIKQSVGLDCSKDSFHACVCRMDLEQALVFSEVEVFENDRKGFNRLLRWVSKNIEKSVPIVYVMEATGVYHESLAYHLHGLGKHVSVELPNKLKHFFRSLNLKTKTDSADARAIAQVGAERRLPAWRPPAEVFRRLRQYTRLHEQLKCQRVSMQNLLHSKEYSHEVQKEVLQSIRTLIRGIDRQIGKIEGSVESLIQEDAELRGKFANLLTIKGVGMMTAAVIVAETQGFALIRNRKQLVSYAGYDIVERQSGSSVKGRHRISKKGNRHIRRALHFPALAASRFDDRHREIYQAINEKKGGMYKMIGATALQRRLLLMVYAIWKSDQPYDPEYQNKQARECARA